MRVTQRQKEILTGVLIFGLLFGGMACGELMLRLVNYHRLGTIHIINVERDDSGDRLFVRDPTTGILHGRPGFRNDTISINELGFRSPPLEQPKPAGRICLAFVGSSTTFDLYARSNAATYPSLTFNALKELVPTCAIDYANIGIAGAGLQQFSPVIENYAAPIEPDIVVLFPSVAGNEIGHAARVAGWNEPPPPPDYFEQNSMLWRLVKENAAIIRLQRLAAHGTDKVAINVDAFGNDYQHRLEDLIHETQAHHSLVVLVAQNGRLRRSQKRRRQIQLASADFEFLKFISLDTLLNLREAIDLANMRAAAETGVITIPPVVPDDKIYWFDSVHFTELGSRKLAQETAKGIAASEAFKTLVRARSCSPFPDLAGSPSAE